VVSSPLLRCRRTVEPLTEALCLEPVIDERFAEVDYGDWTGRKISELASEPLWRVVQAHPSAAVFPGGEGLAQVQARAVAAVREHDRRLAAENDGDALWVACTHGDVIKSLIADAYGIHLDGFQRVTADPASVSVIRYTELRPFVLHVNHTGGRLSAALRAGPRPRVNRATNLKGRKARRARRCRRVTRWSAAPRIDSAAPTESNRTATATAGILEVPCPAQFMSSAHPTASWPGPLASPETAPSTSRRYTMPCRVGGAGEATGRRPRRTHRGAAD